jgi:RHS repeat-associated protein
MVVGLPQSLCKRGLQTALVSLTSKTDYYPFGMPMPNKHTTDNNYRYAFQGQEKDGETGMEAFELRLWDGRIGRWLTVDPYHEFFSPYVGMGNNPISLIDPDGGSTGGGDPCEGCPVPVHVLGGDNVLNEVVVTGYKNDFNFLTDVAIPYLPMQTLAYFEIKTYLDDHSSGYMRFSNGKGGDDFGRKRGKKGELYGTDDNSMATPYNGGGMILKKWLHLLNRIANFTQGVKETAATVENISTVIEINKKPNDTIYKVKFNQNSPTDYLFIRAVNRDKLNEVMGLPNAMESKIDSIIKY